LTRRRRPRRLGPARQTGDKGVRVRGAATGTSWAPAPRLVLNIDVIEQLGGTVDAVRSSPPPADATRHRPLVISVSWTDGRKKHVRWAYKYGMWPIGEDGKPTITLVDHQPHAILLPPSSSVDSRRATVIELYISVSRTSSSPNSGFFLYTRSFPLPPSNQPHRSPHSPHIYFIVIFLLPFPQSLVESETPLTVPVKPLCELPLTFPLLTP